MAKKHVPSRDKAKILRSIAGRVHTIDSFGRTLIAEVLRRAAGKGSEGEAQNLMIGVSGVYWDGPGKYCVDVEVTFDDGSALVVQLCMQGDVET